MAEKTIEQRVKDIIVEQLGVNADQVTPDAKFIEDLGADSLDTIRKTHGHYFTKAGAVTLPELAVSQP